MEHQNVESGWIPFRQKDLRQKLLFIIAAIWTLFTLAYLLNIFIYFGFVIPPVSQRAISSMLIVIIVYLALPFNKKTKRFRKAKMQWYEFIPIILVAVSCIYIAFASSSIMEMGRISAYPYEMVLITALFICLFEAVRRTVGIVVVCLIIMFLVYAIFSDHFPSFLKSTGFDLDMCFGWMYVGGEGLWGITLGTVATIVAGFVIFGAFLRACGASKFFLDLAFAIGGTLRGGAAKTAIVASGLFGTVSGSTAANVATTGLITIPLMKSTGYSKNMAGGIECTASLGGMFMPPVMGATAFLIADFLQISYWSVCVSAFLPAVVYYAVLFYQVDCTAAKLNLRGLPKEQIPKLSTVLKSGWQYIVPFLVLIWVLGILRWSAQTAVLYTLASLLIVSSFRKSSRLTPSKICLALEDSAKGMMFIIPVCTAIGILVGSVQITGVAMRFTSELLELSGGHLILILIMSGTAAFILGMGMTAISVYIMTVVLIAPALIRLGVPPLAAHMFLFYFGCLAFITPPVAVEAFIAAGISGGHPFKTGFQAMRLGFGAYIVPWAFVFSPGILWMGGLSNIATSFIFVALAGICGGSVFEGYFFGRLRWYGRALMLLALVCVFPPIMYMRITGLIILVIIFVIQLYRKSLKKKEIKVVEQLADIT